MMENEGDRIGMLSGIRTANDFLGFMGVVPDLVPWIIGLTSLLGKKSNTGVLINYTVDTISKSREANKHSTVKDTKQYDTFLKKVLDREAQGSFKMPNIMDACSSNIGAGSDTTAITLSSALYYLYTNPDKLAKVREEIDSQAAEGRISDPVTFQEAQGLTYLQAVIKETLRIHPAVGTILPRVVPKGGVEMSGYYFPAGVWTILPRIMIFLLTKGLQTEVGVNSWVLHYDKNIYGPDPETYRPERWIGNEKTSIMESMMFAVR